MTQQPGADALAPAPARSGLTRRQIFERRQRRRANRVAALSTTIVLAAIVFLIPLTPGWDNVRKSFFDGGVFRSSFRPILRAFAYDVQIFVWCAPSIVIVGLLISLARGVRNPAFYPLRLGATVYTDVVRGVPVLLWIFLIGFGVVGLINSRSFFGSYTMWGSVALVMVYSAYVSEVFRAGIESIHESQRAAARSLGLSGRQTMRHVVLPQAVRRVVPPLMNDFISLQKDVALISLLGPVEALRRATVIKDRTFNFTPYLAAAVLFLCISIPLTRLTDYLFARERRRTSGTLVG